MRFNARPDVTAAVLTGLLALGAIVATDQDSVPHPAPESAWKLARDRGCRWEVAAGAHWLDAPYGNPSPETQQPVTLPLDQCSGRTWTLAFSRGGFKWWPVRQDPDWAVVLERP